MGYDSAITVFSPDGRLFQVEYAIEAVRQGSPTIGLRLKDAVILIARKKDIPPLMESTSVQKIFLIDSHIGASISGLHADARVLIDYARVQAQIERLTYDEPIMVETLVKKISDLKQQYTQQAGVRPFGIAFLIAGVDSKGPQLYSTDPSGTYYGWDATVIGKDSKIKEYLEKHYNKKLSLEDAIILGLKALKTGEGEQILPETVEIGYITTETKIFRILSEEENKNYISKL
ncbi:MAG: archaeal proteasome endopeptidase complex subunit alpha [Candidatus Odinarchaeum yellowstonii]|uniref:Proteasome subunit alpha n=1 Tax=Odinarchaeota yellowstonii (strain LCB_4) TaxID=1841599 RepID=A0AAF0IB96_ODILC|nr:MAG: archaeal proteasome endopeptidase complex subunit alpha [Candidatus Odinarchaeum yellowstonii]